MFFKHVKFQSDIFDSFYSVIDWKMGNLLYDTDWCNIFGPRCSIKTRNGNIFKSNPAFLSEKARKAIFGIQMKLKNSFQVPPTHMFYLFETLVQPILLYGSDLWGAYDQCTKEIDAVFMWFIRSVLRVKATTCNIITIGETGMIPPSFVGHRNVLLNFIRLNCVPEGSVVKMCSKSWSPCIMLV